MVFNGVTSRQQFSMFLISPTVFDSFPWADADFAEFPLYFEGASWSHLVSMVFNGVTSRQQFSMFLISPTVFDSFPWADADFAEFPLYFEGASWSHLVDSGVI